MAHQQEAQHGATQSEGKQGSQGSQGASSKKGEESVKVEDLLEAYCSECGMGSTRQDWQSGGRQPLLKQIREALQKKDADVAKLVEQLAGAIPKQKCDTHTPEQLAWDKDHRKEIDDHVKAASEKQIAMLVAQVQEELRKTATEPPTGPGRQYPTDTPPTSQLSAGTAAGPQA